MACSRRPERDLWANREMQSMRHLQPCFNLLAAQNMTRQLDASGLQLIVEFPLSRLSSRTSLSGEQAHFSCTRIVLDVDDILPQSQYRTHYAIVAFCLLFFVRVLEQPTGGNNCNASRSIGNHQHSYLTDKVSPVTTRAILDSLPGMAQLATNDEM